MTAFIKVEKRDRITGKIVKIHGAKYLINKITTDNQEIDGEVLTREPIIQTVAYPNEVRVGTEENPYTTTDEGTFTTPLSLNVGIYELVEITAPEDYILSGYERYTQDGELKEGYEYDNITINKVQDTVKFKIATTENYEEDPNLATSGYNGGNKNGNKIIVKQYNMPQLGTLKISKTGDVLTKTQVNEQGVKEFIYEEGPVINAEFSVYAEEDIYTNDNQTDNEGNKTKYYNKDDKVADIKTNAEGNAFLENIPMGKYYIKEIEAGYGFVLNKEVKHFVISPDNLDENKLVEGERQKTAIIYDKTEKEDNKQTIQNYKNERQKIKSEVTKVDEENINEKIQGAEFRLYVAEDIKNEEEETIAERGDLVGIAISNENGIAEFNVNIPFGKYYIKEEKAPKGYVTNKEEKINVVVDYEGQDKEEIILNNVFPNKKIKVKIQIFDQETKEKLNDTVLRIRDKDGNIVTEFKIDDSDKIVEKLEKGEKYYIEEVTARENYINDLLYSNDNINEGELEKRKTDDGLIEFEVKDTEDLQIVTVENKCKVGKLKIEKTGDVLVGTHKNDNGEVIYEYEKQDIDTAEFEIYTTEEIAHPDGKTGTIIDGGVKVGEGHTENGILELDQYYEDIINEKEAKIQSMLNRGLPLGKYEIIEIKAPKGYWLDKSNNKTDVEVKANQNTSNLIDITTAQIDNIRQTVNIGSPKPKLIIEKRAEKDVYEPGEEAVYKINVRNQGTTIIKDIVVSEKILEGSFDKYEGSDIIVTKQNNQTMVVKELKPEENVILLYRYKIPEGHKGIIENKVEAEGTPIVPNNDPEQPDDELPPVKTEDEEEIPVKDNYGILVKKKALNQFYAPGDIAKYEIQVINTGKIEIKNIKVEEKLIDGKFKEQNNVTIKDGIAIIDSLKEEEKVTLIYEYTVPEDAQEGSKIENTVKATGEVIPEDSENPDDPQPPISISDEDTEIVLVDDMDLDVGIYKIDEETNKPIEGAKFGLYSAEDIIIDGKIILKKDELIKEAYSDSKGLIRFGKGYPLGKYYVKEIEPKPGYEQSDIRIDIDATELEESKAEYKVKNDRLNRQTEIKVLKTELIKDNKVEVIEGATLQIIDKKTNKVEKEWKSEKEPTVIRKLLTENIYILHEKEPSQGYVTSKDIEFSIDKYGKLIVREEFKLKDYDKTIVMQDDVTKVKVHFKDKESNKQLPGGKIEVRDKNGKVVYTIETKEMSHGILKNFQ